MRAFPSFRVRDANRYDADLQGEYVLYWMIASRRTRYNFGLQRAIDWARVLAKPLLVIEPLSCNYRWACDRFHRFILDGMIDNHRNFARHNIAYHSYLEPHGGDGDGLIGALTKRAAVVVTDDYPAFFLPRIVSRFARTIEKKCELVDSNGLLPVAAATKCFARAFDFRRFLQKHLKPHLLEFPDAEPLSTYDPQSAISLDPQILKRWPQLAQDPGEISLKEFPIDHSVATTSTPGGSAAAESLLHTFLGERLEHYVSRRNLPEESGTTGLSPYLHFGHISTHEIFHRVTECGHWQIQHLAETATGGRNGWWGCDENTEALLDQLITWRELGFNMCHQRSDYARYRSLPAWAQQTLGEHAKDPRPFCYELEEFDGATTHDPLWNAIQRQLVNSGRVHNYLRMLWGKKILEWSSSPQRALRIMIHLNNKYALDGRDPNSYSGIFWTLGRYDRAWGPERPIFGKIRYMSSENTARKLPLRGYLEKWQGEISLSHHQLTLPE